MYRQKMGERFSYYNFHGVKESIWIHAVSLGESISAVPLVKSLLKKYPHVPIVVTTMTPTGAAAIQRFLGDQVLQVYVPYDYPFAVKRFLDHFNPQILVLMETELWPNILHYTAARKIPIVLGNARLSAKSFNGYSKIKMLIQPILNCITKVLAQSRLDGDRFLSLGLDPKKLSITSNIKFDLEIPATVVGEAQKLRSLLGVNRPIWVAASTHEGEEAKVMISAEKILSSVPAALLILVPRHPERFEQVFNLCAKEKFEVLRYSEIEKYSDSTSIILGDVMGKLLVFYGASDVAFVGGSLVAWGGHNLLEPAALAKPVISGPHLSAFLEISQILDDSKALTKVADEDELAQNVIKFLQDAHLREKFGAKALDVCEKYRGATKKISEVIDFLLASR